MFSLDSLLNESKEYSAFQYYGYSSSSITVCLRSSSREPASICILLSRLRLSSLPPILPLPPLLSILSPLLLPSLPSILPPLLLSSPLQCILVTEKIIHAI